MISLPPALAPWARELAIFPDEIALCVGQAAARLSLLLGPWPQDHHLRGEPNGYDGVSRRGTYERLLATEWLLLDELPDEFFRRVVSHEHAFLAPAFVQRTGGKHCTVLFDAGPEQLGAPRVAHLAILIALAQRAAAARATFEWSVLSDGPLVWSAEVSHRSVLELVQQRTTRPLEVEVLASHLADANARTSFTPPAAERWVVGGSAVTRAAARDGAHTIIVTDLVESGRPRRVEVTTALAGREAQRRVTLELPADRLAVQLLRDPFAVTPAHHLKTATMKEDSALVFSYDDRRLFAMTADGGLVAIPVPTSTRATLGAIATFTPPPGERLVAVGRNRGARAVVVCANRAGLVVHVLSKRGSSSIRSTRYACDDELQESGCRHLRLRELVVYAEDRLYFRGDSGSFIVLHGGQARFATAEFTYAVTGGPGSLSWVSKVGNALVWNFHVGTASDPLQAGRERRVLLRTTGQPKFGRVLISRARAPLIAVGDHAPWHVVCEHREYQIEALHFSAHGFLATPHDEPTLLAIDAQHQRVVSLAAGATETLFSSSSRILQLEAAHAGQVVAVLDERRGISLYSFSERKFLMRSTAEEHP